MATGFVGVLSANYIFVGVETREDFDKIDRPMIDQSFTPEKGHVLVKTVVQEGVTACSSTGLLKRQFNETANPEKFE